MLVSSLNRLNLSISPDVSSCLTAVVGEEIIEITAAFSYKEKRSLNSARGFRASLVEYEVLAKGRMVVIDL
uniref:Uncharacterized protein n=1 Tax=Pristionchus pacificus TaxID=54126 RepID=A0A2A6CI44_PRIPA|eukprot:PDM77723.1 hypothetical protein PRIPAC_34590 [Pristionchus pacificus]